jgi:hypothetical protein
MYVDAAFLGYMEIKEILSCNKSAKFYECIMRRGLEDYNFKFTSAKIKPLKKTRIKLYNTLALPVLLYGSETWTIKARDARRITAAEMKYMRRTTGYTWTDYKTNLHITK